MPRTAILTPEEAKKRQSDRVNKYIKERRSIDPEFANILCERSKKSIAKKKAKQEEELKKLREFYEANKNKNNATEA